MIPDESPFLDADLTPQDQITFAVALQAAIKEIGKTQCWCLKEYNSLALQGFKTTKVNIPLYKNKDARPLLLAMIGSFKEETRNIIVRRSVCKSKYCINPTHYYWGTRSDVAYEESKRSFPIYKSLTKDLIMRLRLENEEGISIKKLAEVYKIPYHTARRICNKITYEDVAGDLKPDSFNEVWEKLLLTCKTLTQSHPTEVKNFRINYLMNESKTCPWHQPSEAEHKGNFGLMGECLDCMEEIKKGRCTVDVTNFDFRTFYWQAKTFWDQVDIQGSDDCWVWQGATRKHGTESTAYFLSPFHAAKTQSASRVAFWLSRGYTGRYRIFSRPTCKAFCCNPTHLTIRELKNCDHPNEIETIKLTHGNIFKQHQKRKSNLERKPNNA